MAAAEELARAVRARAHQRCQYCLMHEILQGATFHTEQVVPQLKGGRSILKNLALACPGCNLRKGSRVKAVDPATGDSAHWFHTVRQGWMEHFRFKDYEMEGLTDSGRATIAALDMNQARRQLIRKVEEVFGALFPDSLAASILIKLVDERCG